MHKECIEPYAQSRVHFCNLCQFTGVYRGRMWQWNPIIKTSDRFRILVFCVDCKTTPSRMNMKGLYGTPAAKQAWSGKTLEKNAESVELPSNKALEAKPSVIHINMPPTGDRQGSVAQRKKWWRRQKKCLTNFLILIRRLWRAVETSLSYTILSRHLTEQSSCWSDEVTFI